MSVYLLGAALGSLVVVATRHDFLARGAQEDGVLELGRHAARHVGEWWVVLYNTLRHEMAQTKQVVLLAQAVEVAAAEG